MVISEKAQRQLWFWIVRLAALVGIAYEAVGQNGERPFFLTVYVAMMGLPNVVLGGKPPPNGKDEG